MSLTEMKLESHSKIRIDFGGGNLSSDGGLLLMKEFLSKVGFERLAAAKFKTIDGAKRFHSDVENLMQVMYVSIPAHFLVAFKEVMIHGRMVVDYTAKCGNGSGFCFTIVSHFLSPR